MGKKKYWTNEFLRRVEKTDTLQLGNRKKNNTMIRNGPFIV
jgi:hypothetical protein